MDVLTYLPDTESDTIVAKAVVFDGWLPPEVTAGREAATEYELFGRASSMGLTATASRTVTLPNNKGTITLSFTGIVDSTFPANHPYFPSQRGWSIQTITVVSSTGGFNIGQIISVTIPVTPGNPRAAPYGLTTCGLTVRVTETSSQNVPQGRQAAFGYELLGDANFQPDGFAQEAAFTQSGGGGKQIKIIVRAVVERDLTAAFLSNFAKGTATATWTDFTYRVDPANTGGNWSVNDVISYTLPVSPGNHFKNSEVSAPVGVSLSVTALKTSVQPPIVTGARLFENNSQLNDVSFYNSLLAKSNESGPEHEIVYVNEMVSNAITPQYTKLTLAGLALKASRNFTSLNQLRVWLADGISVRNFQLGTSSAIGPSNKFTDLVYYLLTDKTAGAGNIVSPNLIDEAKLPATSQFLEQNKLFFDGAIDQPTNIRQFISDLAPFFLCSFVISNGQFSIVPAVPFDESGNISQAPIKIQQLFTSGNIIEDSFSVE